MVVDLSFERFDIDDERFVFRTELADFGRFVRIHPALFDAGHDFVEAVICISSVLSYLFREGRLAALSRPVDGYEGALIEGFVKPGMGEPGTYRWCIHEERGKWLCMDSRGPGYLNVP